MIVEKKGKTTIYKCGKRYEKPKIKAENQDIFKGSQEVIETDGNFKGYVETVTEPESIPDKKNKKKTLKEG